MRRRDIIPEDAFKPSSGLQKLDKLPEESQKHLRNQLREIIVQGDPWKPGDEETEYPYTPSVAASTNPSLEKQEKEAWGELVDSYHDRESQMYENSSGSQAARGSEQGSSNSPKNDEGSTGSAGQDGEGSQGQQPGQEGNPDQSNSEGTYSLNGSNDPNANSTAGVSQNAMEFLQGLGEGGGNSETGNGETPTEDGGQGESPTGTDASSQAQTGQQDSSEPGSPTGNSTPNPARDPNAKSTAGTSQNAMEFLKGNTGQGEKATDNGTSTSENNEAQGEQDVAQTGAQQAGQEDGTAETQDSGQQEQQASAEGSEQADGEGDEKSQNSSPAEIVQNPASSVPPASTSPVSSTEPEEESTAGASQNALEYLMEESTQVDDDINNQADTNQPEGTLTIQDLLNARGVDNATGTQPLSSGTDEAQLPDETKSDKDGDG
jgi:hypothetical protein